MKYKLAGLALVLLIASPAFAQKVSPVVVETLRTTIPTVVKTGEPFRQTYRLRFFDSNDQFEEIKIEEDELSSALILGSFEVLDFNIVRDEKQADYLENVWYLEYTLRIINEKKGNYKIPRITIPWSGKRIGDDGSSPLVNTDIKTQEVYVSYVTTITEDPQLSIRDDVDFGSFSNRAFWLRISSWVLVIIPPVLWLWMLKRSFRLRREQNINSESFQKSEGNDAVATAFKNISKKEAARNLSRNLKRLKHLGKGKGGNDTSEKLITDLSASIAAFLRMEVPGSSIGTTPREMFYLVSDLKPGQLRSALFPLSLAAVRYQEYLERGFVPDDFISHASEESNDLRTAFNGTKRHVRFFRFIKKILSSLREFRFSRKGK